MGILGIATRHGHHGTTIVRSAHFSTLTLPQKSNVNVSHALSALRCSSTSSEIFSCNGTSIPDDHTTNKPSALVSPIPNFDDVQEAYGGKTTMELMRAYTVLRLCQIQPLVKHSDTLLRQSRRFLGAALTDAIMKNTLFNHFCGGETEEDLQPVIARLQANGIGGILDYAAEDDGSGDVEHQDAPPKKTSIKTPSMSDKNNHVFSNNKYNQPARVYDYESENVCDEHVKIFKSCIQAVHNVSPDGFAALKVTALGNPLLLERMSSTIVEVKKLFAKFDTNNDGIISPQEFEKGYRFFFDDADTKISNLIDYLDSEYKGQVDYITWSKMLTPADIPQLTSRCKEQGSLALATPTKEELELLQSMHDRAHDLADLAFSCGTRLLIDAEQARFQPAIDNLVLELQAKYNATDKTNAPIIFDTYQCYLKDVPERLRADVERCERFSYHFGAKLVRGAYMESERDWAKQKGIPSPIHETIEDTHKTYDDSVEFLLRHAIKSDKKFSIMCATHNRESVERAITVMNELGIDRSENTVNFAQLYGMADNLTYNLGRHGYRSYKYLPYGKVSEVMPYLIRRAQENSAIMGNTAKELVQLRDEVKRRLYC
mmetsp:Transcript_23811/g.36805  ORF Transcript_23811/g.36805 Transcript_23811/m.36805 type:complete len:601 (+) Transcript_23811:73-1875(+)